MWRPICHPLNCKRFFSAASVKIRTEKNLSLPLPLTVWILHISSRTRIIRQDMLLLIWMNMVMQRLKSVKKLRMTIWK